MKKLLKNQLIAGSLVIFFSTAIGNVGSYLYHLLMGRMLGPSDYGIFVSLISLIYIISVFPAVLGRVVVRFASTFKAKGNYSQIYSLFREFSQKFFILGLIIFLIFVFGHRLIGQFLKITNYSSIILIAVSFLIGFLALINNGLLQSFLNFNFLAANGVLSTLLKLLIGFGLVKAGLSVFGAVLALVLSGIVPYFISFFPLRFLFKYKPRKIEVDWQEIIAYAKPTFIVMLSLTSLYTVDIILVKHFFNPYQAGLYSALATLGKIIFFASGTVAVVMFPLIAQNYENGKEYKNILFQSLLLVSLASVGITGIYFLVPKLVIRMLYSASYFEIAPFLGIFGIFISIYSLISVLVNFFLSIHKTKIAFLLAGAALVQAGLIWKFHYSFLQVIRISIMVAVLLLFSLLLYYFRIFEMRKNKSYEK